MSQADNSYASATLSGRELAQKRRKAMALHGKTAVQKTSAGRTRASATAASVKAKAAAATNSSSQAAPSSAVTAAPSGTPGSSYTPDTSKLRGRALAKARREALSKKGKKSGLAAPAQPQRSLAGAKQDVTNSADIQATPASAPDIAATVPVSDGRRAAMQQRKKRSVQGKAQANAPRPCGRQRKKADKPITEALEAPSEAVAQVKKASVSAMREARVTGTELTRTPKITGDESAMRSGVTGTEYLPGSSEAKSAAGNNADPQRVTGTQVGRSKRVTGDESGSCRQITGTEYLRVNDAAPCYSNAPKVRSIPTQGGRTVTGSDLARSSKITGTDQGSCTAVTGIDYVSGAQLKEVCATPVADKAVEKVSSDHTFKGQSITGTPMGRGSHVTGDESGGCAPISGTPYVGRQQFGQFCQSPEVSAQEARLPSRGLVSATAVTGDRPGAGGAVMTGDDRGACEPVSGTPYVGADNMAPQCATDSQFLAKSQQWDQPSRPPAPSDFSVQTPARAGQAASSGVTGTVYNSERITGPINKAAGLITGTPEFRHADGGSAHQGQAQMPASAGQRLTGEGSQAGVRVTGDAWDGSSRITGTEGHSSQMRNPSMRGQPRGEGANARRFRETVELPPAPTSRITGSSGSCHDGPLVTLSGGARG